MKVWKFAAIASMLFSSMLSILVCRDALFGTWKSHLSSSSQLSSALSSSMTFSSGTRQRSPRSLDHDQPLISQYSALFESYTEGEVKQLISMLVERYRQSTNSGEHELPSLPKGGNRMKRARARHKPCEIKELEVSVSDLGLGYESDETILFRYCSGTCDSSLRNYDLSLKNMRSKKKIKKEKLRARPCCRPLLYDDDISFLDVYNHYYTIKELSAKTCGCI